VVTIARRRYDQYCPVACSLDLLGERWTLLIVRNLLAGPQRYSDLAAQLPAMASNLLTTRLRDLESHGVVRRTALPPPAARTVYELTERGRELEAVICALGRWGTELLAEPDPNRAYQPQLLALGLKTLLRVEALPPTPLRFAFDLDVGAFVVEVLGRRTDDGRLRSVTDRVAVRAVDSIPADVAVLVQASATALAEGRLDEARVTGGTEATPVVRELLGLDAAA
jgi:DNA-binding HxlR family transcriptional regulator